MKIAVFINEIKLSMFWTAVLDLTKKGKTREIKHTKSDNINILEK